MKIKYDNVLIPVLNVRQVSKDKKVVTVGVVTRITDSYDSVIDPDGCLTPLEGVVVDYNHNRISTGAKIINKKKGTILVPDGNGGERSVEALIAEIEVYKDSQMIRQNPDITQAAIVEGSLYDAVENGRVSWVSVDFDPVKNKIEYVKDAAGNLIREVYTQWRLNFLSFLDTKPGQDTSYILNIRQLNFKRSYMNLTQIKQQITEMLDGMNVEVSSIDNVELEITSDNEGKVEFLLNGDEHKQMDYVTDNKGDMKFSNFADIDEAEEEKEEGGDDSEKENVETDKSKEGEEGDNKLKTDTEETQEAAQVTNEENDKKAVEAPAEKTNINDDAKKKEEENNKKKRAYIGCVIKNTESGDMGVVTGKLQIQDGASQIDQVKVKLSDGTEDVINDSDISYGYEAPMDDADEVKPWTIANDGDIFLYFLNKQPAPAIQEMAEKDQENGLMNAEGEEEGKLSRAAKNEEHTRQLKEKDDKITEVSEKYKKLVRMYNRLSNSPDELDVELDPAGTGDELDGEGAEENKRKKDFGEEVIASRIRNAK